MATFIIVPTSDATAIDAALSHGFGNKVFKLPKGEWLVSYEGTSRQLSEELGISTPEGSGKIGSAIVLNFSGYWGNASRDIWEWIKENGD